MDTATFLIKRHDALPVLKVYLRDVNDEPVDLSPLSTAVYFIMKNVNTGTAAITGNICTIVDVDTAIVQYTWAATDTAIAGDYLGEFEIRYADGNKLTVPTEDTLSVIVIEDYNNE